MSWIDAPGVERRPLVIVEDHLHHAGELVHAIAAAHPQVVPQLTLCAIDRAGPDTDASVRDWLRQYPELHVASPVSASAVDPSTRDRAITLGAGDLADAASVGRLVARLLRPGGLLVQDVQLSTLPFVPADRWWESIYVAATVRGILNARPPIVRFVSNKRGYSATFGRELMEAGFDPRDVMDKGDLQAVVVPTIVATLERQFPLRLRGRIEAEPARDWIVAADDSERRDVECAFDLVLWPAPGGVEIGGRLVAGGRVAIKPGSHESATWRALIDDRLDSGTGLPVTGVGERIGPPTHSPEHRRLRRIRLVRRRPRRRRNLLRLHRLRRGLDRGTGGPRSTARHAARHPRIAGDLHRALRRGVVRAGRSGAVRAARRAGTDGGRHRSDPRRIGADQPRVADLAPADPPESRHHRRPDLDNGRADAGAAAHLHGDVARWPAAGVDVGAAPALPHAASDDDRHRPYRAVAAGFTPISVLGHLVSIGTLFAFVVVSLGVLVLRRTHPTLPRPFRTPWVPVVPIASAAVSFLLMLSLPKEIWERLAIWMAIGLAIYFLYGRRRSLLQER